MLRGTAAKPFAPQIISASRQSFVDGMHTAVLIALVVLLIAAAIVIRFLPARARDEEDVPAAAVVAPVPV